MNQLHRSYKRAYLLAEQGRYDLATCEIQELLAHNSNNSQAYMLLSDCFSKQKRHQEAISAAKQAITLSPQHEACYYTLARAYSWHGKWLNAQEAINVALQINPNMADFLAQASLILLRKYITTARRDFLKLFSRPNSRMDTSSLFGGDRGLIFWR